MSIVRFGEDGSDVYVYYGIEEGLRCCACALLERAFASSFFGNDKEALKAHMQEHRERGDRIPDWLDEQIDHYDIGV